MKDQQDQSFDAVRMRYENLDSIKLVLFIKLESSISQRQTNIIYEITLGWTSSPCHSRYLKVYFKNHNRILHTTKNNSVIKKI